MTVSPNISQAKLEDLSTLIQNNDAKENLGAAAVASPAPNYNGFNNLNKL